MAAKAVFILFAQALFIQSALSQTCSYSSAAPAFGYNSLTTGWIGSSLPCNRLTDNGLTFNGLPTGLASNIINAPAVEITPTSGGALPVTSASPIAPNSILVESENVYEGTLAVAGELPFVGTVGLEGDLPTVGSGAVNHACGNGATRMVSQDGAIIDSLGVSFTPATALDFGNMYGRIEALGNAAATAPLAYGTGLAGLIYPTAGLAGAYPTVNYASGLVPYGAIGSDYGAALAPAAAYGGAIALAAAYGGAGEGNVAVAGELPVAGNTALAGQVPIMGVVSFSGAVPAAGAVSITGNCACGCGNSYFY